MKIIKSLLFILMAAEVARADQWTPRLNCESDRFVVDGYRTEKGFTQHQVVIRDSEAVRRLSSLVGSNLANSAGEIVIQLGMPVFSQSFSRVKIIDLSDPVISSKSYIYYLDGKRLDSSRFQLFVFKKTFHYGGSNRFDYALQGDWIFNDCREIP